MTAIPSNSPAPGETPATAIRVHCPHCGHQLDVVPIAMPPAASQPHTATQAASAGHSPLIGLLHQIVAAQRSAGQEADSSAPRAAKMAMIAQQRWLLLGIVLLMAALVVALIVWAQAGAVPLRSVSSAPTAAPTSSRSAIVEQEAAICDTLTRYNAAETEAAALLSIAPIEPYLVLNGPFATRRAAEIAERRRRNAPHRSILIRWGIGTIAIHGDTATAITQETWSNQETGEVAPAQATVRVTYTLRWDEAAGRWLIVDTSQMPL